MRFRNPSLAGKRSALVRAERRLASDPPIYRPQEGLLVGILRYTDCVAGKSTEVRKRCVIRWLHPSTTPD
jgi:hypothetical protein